MFGGSLKRAVPALAFVLAAIALAPLGAQDPGQAYPGQAYPGQGNPAQSYPGQASPGQANAEPDGQYETGRAVARISVLNGDVSVRRGDSGDVVAAALNAPLMADDRLLTGSSSRAEVQLDSANVVRVGPSSEVRFIAMDVKTFQIQVAMGTVTFRTLRPTQAQVEVDTPSVAVHPLQPGAYRVSVHEDGTSEITVRLGEAEIDSQRGGERLEAGQTMDARGPAADPEFQVAPGIPRDAFDRWNEERDRYIEGSQSYQHVSPSISGAEDLDQSGRWVNDPNYGSVWQPTVGPDWAPYQNGRWVWEDYYGWTWVSYDPWGWAPYHYGRWFWGGGGWAWWPGPIYAHPFWAPAYVGFFGFGGGFGIGVGFGFGGLGWVALAPFELFHPWWGRGFYAGFRGGFFGGHTTIVNNFNVYGSFRNASVRGGAIGVSTAGFGRGGVNMALNRGQLQSAGAVRGALPVAPDRSSLRFSDRAVSGRYTQARTQSFASRMQAPRVAHASFDQQQRGMQQMSRGSFSQAGGSQRSLAPSGSHGWGTFGEPIHGVGGGASGGGYGGAGAARSNPAVRVSPPIVQQRGFSSQGGYSAPRSFGGTRATPSPSYSGGNRSGGSARGLGGGSAPRGSSGGGRSGGGGHSSGGGGHRR